MAEMIFPVAAMVGLAHAAPQGLGLGNAVGAGTGSQNVIAEQSIEADIIS